MTTATMRNTDFAYGDVQCLNCGRTLGAAIKRRSDNATSIRPLEKDQPLLVEWRTGVGLRCKACNGRAFIEYDEFSTAAVRNRVARSAAEDKQLVA